MDAACTYRTVVMTHLTDCSSFCYCRPVFSLCAGAERDADAGLRSSRDPALPRPRRARHGARTAAPRHQEAHPQDVSARFQHGDAILSSPAFVFYLPFPTRIFCPRSSGSSNDHITILGCAPSVNLSPQLLFEPPFSAPSRTYSTANFFSQSISPPSLQSQPPDA